MGEVYLARDTKLSRDVALKVLPDIFRATYDVAPDGRFLGIEQIPEPAGEGDRKIFASTLRLVLNWTEELQRLLAAPRQ